ncbi:uncharacterized protein LOC117104820 [Anneissia japonica]|uniref:uncharacterized protein LOC117104820 n=1 Tax=Anneissia japonica TaxID=1529436 RepID=UPI0014257B3D|nr:uncharacterized protein LOC117104820 [Anneissia japonica]
MCNHISNNLDFIRTKHPDTGIFILGDFNRMKDAQLKQFPNFYETPYTEPGLGLSDHLVVLCRPNLVSKRVPPTKSYQYKRKVNNQAKELFEQDLTNIRWHELYAQATSAEQYEFFASRIRTLVEKHFPLIQVVRTNVDKPWVTSYYKSLIFRRQAELKKGNMIEFRKLRNKVNKASKKLRRRYYEKEVSQLYKVDVKSWWSKTNRLLNSPLNYLTNSLCNGNQQELAEKVAKFFNSVTDDFEPLQNPTVAPLNTPVLDNFIITHDQIYVKLKALSVNKSPGPESIPTWVLKDFANILAKPLCAVANSSLRESCVPHEWKAATIVPIQKDKIDLNQFGCMKGVSTVDALISIMFKWFEAADQGNETRVLLLDYKKAFDLIDHTIVIEKQIKC